MYQGVRLVCAFVCALLASFALLVEGLPGGPRPVQAATCSSTTTPLGALPPAIPIWCRDLGQAAPTFSSGSNSWLDEFDPGPGPFLLGDGYRVFDKQEFVARTQHWRQNNHWMMDLEPGGGLLGGGMMRPDRAFRFEDGRLVVESDVAAGIKSYGAGADIWPEVVVTTAPAPTGKIPDSLYAYGQFGGYWSFGCRYQPTRVPVCSLYNADGAPGDPAIFGTGAGRVWEMSNFEHVGTSSFGGYPDGSLAQAWRTCDGTDPDLSCRDRFRLELTKTSVTIYVNGTKYFEQTGLRVPLPDALTAGDVYVYFAGWEVRQEVDTIRFHWDRLAVNPAGGPSGAPAPLPTSGTPSPNPTPQASPSPTPSVQPPPAAKPQSRPWVRSVSTAVNSTSAPRPTGVMQGDLLLANLEVDADSASVAGPPGWRRLLDTRVARGTSSAFRAQTWYKLATGSEPRSYRWKVPGGVYVDVEVLAIAGADPRAPIDAARGRDAGVATSALTDELSTRYPNELLLAFFTNFRYGRWTAGSGMTQLYDSDSNTAQFSLQAVAGRTGRRSAQTTTRGALSAQIVAIKAR